MCEDVYEIKAAFNCLLDSLLFCMHLNISQVYFTGELQSATVYIGISADLTKDS